MFLEFCYANFGPIYNKIWSVCYPLSSCRQEAAGALWNLSFDDKNREAIAAAGGVEALVCLFNSYWPRATIFMFRTLYEFYKT